MYKFSIAVAVVLSISACTADNSYTESNAVFENGETRPAQFTNESRSLQHVAKFPDSSANNGDVYREVPCVATIRPNGKPVRHSCFVDKDNPYRRAVTEALRSSSINPLILDGVAVELERFHFTVVFERLAGVESISAYAYHRLDETDWDPNYIGSQRYFLGSMAMLWCPGGTRSSATLSNVIAAVEVSAQGVATSPTIVEGRTPCRSNILKVLSDSHYIPAQKHGQPVASVWIERFIFNPSS